MNKHIEQMNKDAANLIGITKAPSFTKYQLADQMRNYMHIDDKFLEGLETYRINHYSGFIFSTMLFDGLVEYNFTSFNVIYHNCSPYHAKRAEEIRLSFREAKDEYQLEPIVLVEIVIPFTATEQ
jgi:hypothetical protein